MIHLITACTANYTKSAENLRQSSLKHGVEDWEVWRIENLPPVIKRMFGENTLEENRAWFYIWKPYVIWSAMQKCQTGDILIYADAGQTFTDSIKPLIYQMDQDIMLFNNPWNHVEWCKADVSKAINGVAWPAIEHKQVQASLIFFRVNYDVLQFVKEWMLWCMMPGFCDNSPSKIENYPTFQEHRYDQAVLTCLQIKHGYKLHQFPSIENGDAPYRMTDHHRKNNEQW